MTINQAQSIKPLNVVIKVGIGKNESFPAYVCKVFKYTAPDGTERIIASVADRICGDSVTGDRPKVYKRFSELKTDYELIRSQGPKVLDIVEV